LLEMAVRESLPLRQISPKLVQQKELHHRIGSFRHMTPFAPEFDRLGVT
jgi:hypothetical protein